MQSINEQSSQEICNSFARYNPRNALHKALLRLTYPIWHPLFAHVLLGLYEKRVIDSSRLHIATALVDQTQQHRMW